MRSSANPRAIVVAALAAVLCVAATTRVHAQSQAAELYKEALAREAQLRRELDAQPAHGDTTLLMRMRTLVTAYEDLSRLFPTSGYSDNALWQAGRLSADAFWQFGDLNDRNTALRLFTALTSRFPTSSLVKRVPEQTARLERVRLPPSPASGFGRPGKPDTTTPLSEQRATAETKPVPPHGGLDAPATLQRPSADATKRPITSASTLKSIRREVFPEALRVTLELEREAPFVIERLASPPRVFVDLVQTRAIDGLKDATIEYDDDVVRRIRVGRQLNVRTRVVLDLQDVGHYSVYALYNPYRIVIDFDRAAAAPSPAPRTNTKVLASAVRKPESVRAPTLLPSSLLRENWMMLPTAPRREGVVASNTGEAPSPAPDTSLAAGDNTSLAIAEAPTAPRRASANRGGGYSFSRQLGLGVARVVIDPGHGGHDPGAKGNGITEADLVLDVALRLEKLLQKQSGVEVVLTRRDNTFVPLEERTALANRAEADLFISIHANASPNPVARGIETYFLNFAPNPEAEAIAARENAGSSRTMRHLSDIVQAIAMNNKIDESRDLATNVQAMLYRELHKTNKDARNLGVKQAPFMVLIGATMPSILTEISFITNGPEASLLKSEKYRQQLADALLTGIMRYQQSLKRVQSVAQAVQ